MMRRSLFASFFLLIATPAGRLDVNGLVADGDAVWLADNTNGVLYRVPAG